MTLADRDGRWTGEFEVGAVPVEVDGHALKDEIKRGADEPHDRVDEVSPPVDLDPALVDNKDTAVEEE